jgi:proline dehydrogenase
MPLAVARNLLLRASRSQWLAHSAARRPFVLRAVSRFMPGEEPTAALDAAAQLAADGLGSVVTCLGERTATADTATAVREHYVALFDDVRARGLPTHVSVKPSHLGLDVSEETCRQTVLELARRADATGSFVWLDMEESWYVERTLALYRLARATTPRVGICLQAYLRRTGADLEELIAFAASVDGGGVAVRLVKGAYRETADVAFQQRDDIDAEFARLGERLIAAATAPHGLAVLGTHDLRLVGRLRESARALGAAACTWEVHMLYGIRAREQHDLARDGVAVRTLISYGREWFPWYMRRLAERPANVWFIVRSMVR